VGCGVCGLDEGIPGLASGLRGLWAGAVEVLTGDAGAAKVVDDDVAGVFLQGGGGFAEADGADQGEEAAVGAVGNTIGDVGVAAYL